VTVAVTSDSPAGHAPGLFARIPASDAGMAFAKECADLVLPFAQDLADWAEAGRP
jgi:hypothetical protein